MPAPDTISAQSPAHPSLDYAFLRQEGIRHLERLAGHIWTDFNTHDPGITILEQLCYAITDLGYRIDHDIKDLLAKKNGSDPYHDFFSPLKILTSGPVTLNDYRKLMIDIPEVKNAWIYVTNAPEPWLRYDRQQDAIVFHQSEKTENLIDLRGLYRVVIEPQAFSEEEKRQLLEAEKENPFLPDPGELSSLDARFERLLKLKVLQQLNRYRNVGEDFESIEVLQEEKIRIQADIEIGAVENAEALLAEIYHRVERFIAADIRFYSLREMLEKGKSIDEILEGPLLRHGFIDQEELEKFEKRDFLRASDLIQVIMQVSGVVVVRSITLMAENRADPWSLKLGKNTFPRLVMPTDLSTQATAPAIRLYRGGLSIPIRKNRFGQAYQAHRQQGRPTELALPDDFQFVPPGRHRNIGNYYSIQNQMPQLYGVGQEGLPGVPDQERKAKSRQLKAYLLFFDQILANYFAQLSQASALFTFRDKPLDATTPTYFTQLPESVQGLESILRASKPEHLRRLQELANTNAENPENGDSPQRVNRLLNHLMARFGEQFTDYSLLLYEAYQDETLAANKLIQDKQAFLRHYPAISGNRGRAFDHFSDPENQDSHSGLAERISLLLGIEMQREGRLVDGDEVREGFYLVEHHLLRTYQQDQEIRKTGFQDEAKQKERAETPQILTKPGASDPFSLSITFVFPKEPARFGNDNFRKFIENTIRWEAPAYLRVNILWFEKERMAYFEEVYADWKSALYQSHSANG